MLKRLLAGLLGIFFLCSITLWGWYQIDGIPTPETEDYLNGDGYRSERSDDGTLLFRPDNPSGRGIVIMQTLCWRSASAYVTRDATERGLYGLVITPHVRSPYCYAH